MDATENTLRDKLSHLLFESAILWGALGLLGGAIIVLIPLLALKWIFAATWTLLTIAIIKERFFHRRAWFWKITGTFLISSLMGIGFVAAWRYIPKPKEPPTLEETATLTARKIIELMPPQPARREYTAAPILKKKEIPLKAEDAFAVAVETRIFTGAGDYVTPFWAGTLAPTGCILKPVKAAFFIRITNLQKERTLITGYTVESMGVPLTRLKMNILKPLTIMGRGVLKPSNEPSLKVQFPVPNGGIGSWVRFKPEDAYLAEARLVESEFLDQQIADHYLEHKQTMRGWAFFQYPKQAEMVPAQLKVKINDETGHTYSYSMPDSGSDQNADAMSRTLSFGPTIDLSACSKER